MSDNCNPYELYSCTPPTVHFPSTTTTVAVPSGTTTTVPERNDLPATGGDVIALLLIAAFLIIVGFWLKRAAQ